MLSINEQKSFTKITRKNFNRVRITIATPLLLNLGSSEGAKILKNKLYSISMSKIFLAMLKNSKYSGLGRISIYKSKVVKKNGLNLATTFKRFYTITIT